MEDLQKALLETIDKSAVREVFARYALTMDSGDAEGFAGLFRENSTWKWETETFKIHLRGRKELRELARVVASTCPGAQHAMSNHVIEIKGMEARGICELTVFLSRPEGIYTAMLGFYDVDFVKVEGSWYISEMRVRVLNPEICMQGKIGEYWEGIRNHLQDRMQ